MTSSSHLFLGLPIALLALYFELSSGSAASISRSVMWCSIPAEDAMTNSLPAHSSEAVLPASAVEVPDQVLSEGASSAPDAAVRLSMKPSSDSSHPERV